MAFFRVDSYLAKLTEDILKKTWETFPTLGKNQIALTVIVDDDQTSPSGYSWRGEEKIYPASVVKLFYLVATYQWLEEGKIKPSSELNRAIRDMIVDSSNDATSLVVDTLTNTTSGPELPPEEFEKWCRQRNTINDYFHSFPWEEFSCINVNQKTWCDGPYGRERMFVGENYQNRNMLTTNAVARLFHGLMNNLIVSPAACEKMRELLKRDASKKKLEVGQEENQINGFIGEAMPDNAQIWSKAGWTSTVRHDAAYVVTPNNPPFLLVIFTEGRENSGNRRIIPYIASLFVQSFGK